MICVSAEKFYATFTTFINANIGNKTLFTCIESLINLSFHNVSEFVLNHSSFKYVQQIFCGSNMKQNNSSFYHVIYLTHTFISLT